MNDWIIWTWFGVWLLIIAAGAYVVGKTNDVGLLVIFIFFGAVWPPLAACALISLPFVGLYYLGRRHQ
jgi:hypothetical protein